MQALRLLRFVLAGFFAGSTAHVFAAETKTSIEAEQLVPFSQLDQKPRIRERVPAEFPRVLTGKLSEGSVKLEFTVTSSGQAADINVLAATAPEFADSAIAALQRWRFAPGMKDGKPVACRMTLPMEIRSDTTPAKDPHSTRANPPEPSSLVKPDRLPEIRKQVPPQYPFDLKSRGIEGKVIVQFMIDEKGIVSDCVAISSSNPGFEPAALDAVRQWRFKPAVKDGRPVKSQMTFPIGFRLGD